MELSEPTQVRQWMLEAGNWTFGAIHDMGALGATERR